MAKFGFGAGQGASTGATTGQGAGGFFGAPGSQQRYDMTMQMVQNAMAQSQGANSPLLAFLAPMAGAAIGARATKQYEDARAAEATSQTEALLGPIASSPKTRAALDVLNDPDAPDYLKSIAATMVKGAAPKASSGRSRGSRRSTPAAAKTRIYGEYEVDGLLYGRDAYGQLVPLRDANGNPIPAKGKKAAAPAPAAP
ncbi:hypothetical protein, partial [Tabrizicola sp.]|uniref:hypothetical protein n=1 Tax=Tabrizicola sp. TaxID=2005166 RepID=UPI002FDE8AFE